jgi:hypothetical protein
MSELKIIQPITVAEAELLEIKSSYENLVVTKETLKQVDAARKFLKTKRLDIQKTVDANKKAIRDLIKQHEDEGDRLVGIIKPIEDRLAKEQKELEDREAAELRAKLKAEEDRKRAIKARIADIETAISNVRKGAFDGSIDNIPMPDKDTFEEYNEEGNSAIEMLYGAIENRKLFIKEQAELEARKKAAELAAQPQVLEQPSPTPREKRLIDLGFTDSGFAWTHANGSKIPYSMMDVADDVFETLLKPFKKLDLFAQSEPTVTDSKTEIRPDSTLKTNPADVNLGEKTSITPAVKPDFDAIVKQTATPEPKAVQTPDLNYFETNGFTIGIDKRIPFSKVLAVKNAIIQTLN